MVSEKQQSGRWLRIGALTVTTFMPLLTAVSSRLFRRSQGKDEYSAEEASLPRKGSAVRESDAVAPEKLQALGAALVDALDDLRTRARPYQQELWKRSEQLAGAVRERGSELSHQVAKRGGHLTHDLAKRGKRARRDLARRSRYTMQELQDLAEQRKGFWIALGFGLGLAVTGILTFRLIRRRQLERQAELLAELGYQAGYRDSHIELSAAANGNRLAYSSASTGRGEQPTAATAAPSDAAFLGLVSNKHYYPIETPLDQLALPGGAPVDIVYFSSEEEAQAQGFSSAR